MDEYVVLAQRMDDDDAEWKVGTFEQVKYWLDEWENQGYYCNVRKCTRPLNIEFVRAGIDKVAIA